MRLLNKFTSFRDKGMSGLAVFAAVLTAFVLVLVTCDVTGRYLFNRPIQNTMELSNHAMLWIVFLGLAWVLKREGHVKMDMVYNMFGPRTRAALDIWATAMGILAAGILFWASANLVYDSWVRKLVFATVYAMPRGPILIIMPIGAFFLMLEYIRQLFSAWRKWRSLRSNRAGSTERGSAFIGEER